MAVEKIALGINLRKNKISTSAGFGKYYPEVDTQKTLSLRGFAQHMVDHGSIYGRAVAELKAGGSTNTNPTNPTNGSGDGGNSGSGSQAHYQW